MPSGLTFSRRRTSPIIWLKAGVAPASDPKFALVVVINNPQNGAYYGGAVSAPVFSQIMGDVLRLENVKPDGMPADSDHLLVMHGSNVSSPSL